MLTFRRRQSVHRTIFIVAMLGLAFFRTECGQLVFAENENNPASAQRTPDPEMEQLKNELKSLKGQMKEEYHEWQEQRQADVFYGDDHKATDKISWCNSQKI